VCFRVLARGVLRMTAGMQLMSVGKVRVMRGLLVIAGFVVLRSFSVVVGSLGVVMSGLAVVACSFL
jgi:hypothetical protein